MTPSPERRPGKLRQFLGGLRARVIMTYLIIFVVSAAIIVARSGAVFASMARDTAEHDLRGEAYLMASALVRPLLANDEHGRPMGLPQLQDLAGRLAGNTSGALTIYDARGSAVASSLAVLPSSGTNAPDVAAALTGHLANDVRFDPISNQSMIYGAAPIVAEGRLLGVVEIGTPLEQAEASVRSFWLSLGLTALLAAVVAVAAGWLLAGQLVRPVDRLRDAATELAAGNLDARVPPKDTGGVTEIVQLGDAFNNMAERIQDTLNRQREFVADASHELRTPLTNIKLRAEALGAGALDDPTVAQRFVGEIESEANRLSRMAADLLTLSRQDAGAPVFRESMDPAGLAEQVVGEMALRAERGGIRLVAQIAPGVPHITGDPVALHTVLVNLVDNALQHTPEGGQVTVCAGARQPASVILAVSDTGSGIPPEDLPHIFDRFYRIDKSRSRRAARRAGVQVPYTGSGAGLGLAIVRGIVEDHGGTVSAESVLGEGTTITVVLPADGAMGLDREVTR